MVPGEIRGWNRGAFFLGWIWGIGNNVRIALLTAIPTISFIPIMTKLPDRLLTPTLILFFGFLLIVSIVLGAKGNEWAWRYKKWDSIEHFMRAQRTWATVGTMPTLAVWLFLVAVIPNIPHPLIRYESPAPETELANIQSAVAAMMLEQEISTLSLARVMALSSGSYCVFINQQKKGTIHSFN